MLWWQRVDCLLEPDRLKVGVVHVFVGCRKIGIRGEFRRQNGLAALAFGKHPECFVGGDAVKPCFKCFGLPELVEIAENLDKRLLHGVLGVGVAYNHASDMPVNRLAPSCHYVAHLLFSSAVGWRCGGGGCRYLL